MTLPILLTAENHDFYLPSSAGAEHGLPMPYAGSGRPADSRPPSDAADIITRAISALCGHEAFAKDCAQCLIRSQAHAEDLIARVERVKRLLGDPS